MPKKLRGYDSLFIRKVEAVDHWPEVSALVEVCIARNVPVTEVAAAFGVTRATIYNWMTGNTEPNPRYLALMPKITARFLKRK